MNRTECDGEGRVEEGEKKYELDEVGVIRQKVYILRKRTESLKHKRRGRRTLQ